MTLKKPTTIVLLLLFFNTLLFGQNLLTNGGFEEIINNEPTFWAKDAWKLKGGEVQFYVDQENFYSGRNSVVIHNTVSNDARLVQGMAVKPSTYYTLSCWVRAENCGQGKKGASIGVIEPQIFQSSPDVKDTKGKWEKLSFTVLTSPEQNTMTVCVRLGFFGNDNTGKAWFDDFSVEESTDSELNQRAVRLPVTASTTGTDDFPQGPSNSWGSGILVILSITGVFALLGVLAYFIFIRPKSNKHLPQLINKESQLVKFTKWDLILCGTLTLIYTIIALTNLGTLSAPQTYWKPTRATEGFIVDFGKPKDIGRIYYWEGLPQGHMTHGVYLASKSEDGIIWETMVKLNPATQSYWYYKEVNVNTRYIRILAETAGALLNEVVFVDNSHSQVIPIVDIMAAPGSTNLEAYKRVIDEQNTIAFRPELYNGMTPGYDEQYHARTAFEHTIFKPPFEDTHPPLGKLFIALGILIFGMNPFGWRIMGTLFGILMIPLMYAFGKELFKRTEFALASALLMAVDFMHFTQSRVSVIDVYGVFFIILMYYFMLQYYKLSFFKTEFRKTLWPLLFSGIACGFGAASKWIAIYGFIGLALLFFISLGKQFIEYKRHKAAINDKKLEDKEERKQIEQIIKAFPEYIIRTLIFCFLVFILIPTAIYAASYMPILMSPDINFNPQWIIDNNTGMFSYHSNVTESHSSSTTWHEWPFIIRPFLYFTGSNLPAAKSQILASFGNPAVWWGGSLLTLVVIGFAIIGFIQRISASFQKSGKLIAHDLLTQEKGKDDMRFIIIVALASQYFPWIISVRKLTFIYHFFASVPFIIFGAVYFFKYIEKHIARLMPATTTKEDESGEITKSFNLTKILPHIPLWLFVLWAIINFIIFYPIISATIADSTYIHSLHWLPRWPW
ncbi:MAG: phospholipid carrier-dependent glycosyltransferase [Spirochaetales bacterium]|nr:phospholipid carrier-dependent glycosyltransferase [Spirochaetales bacterium]